MIATLLPVVSGALFAIRDGLGGNEDGWWRRTLRSIPWIGQAIEQFWRNPGDRMATAGVSHMLGALLVGAGWWKLLPSMFVPGLAYEIGWRMAARGWEPFGFNATRIGAPLHGAGYGAAYAWMALT